MLSTKRHKRKRRKKKKKKDSQKSKKDNKPSAKKESSSKNGSGGILNSIVKTVTKGAKNVKDHVVGIGVAAFKSGVYDTGVDAIHAINSVREKVGFAKAGTAAKSKDKWEKTFNNFEKGLVKKVVSSKKEYYAAKILGDKITGYGGAIVTGKGNKIESTSTVKEGGNYVTLYRGVNENHADYDNSSKGVVTPNTRWWELWKPKSTPLEHNAGKNGTRNSPYTSWTTNPDVAENYALRPSGKGVVLESQEPSSKIVKSPNTKNVQLIQKPDTVVSESEVLLKGKIVTSKIKGVKRP